LVVDINYRSEVVKKHTPKRQKEIGLMNLGQILQIADLKAEERTFLGVRVDFAHVLGHGGLFPNSRSVHYQHCIAASMNVATRN
jgi:hypothetical protein